MHENLRSIAAKYDCAVADQWALREVQDTRMWAPDRLHLNPLGHPPRVPWVLRRIRHQSSGDQVLPKRPEARPYAPRHLEH